MWLLYLLKVFLATMGSDWRQTPGPYLLTPRTLNRYSVFFISPVMLQVSSLHSACIITQLSLFVSRLSTM